MLGRKSFAAPHDGCAVNSGLRIGQVGVSRAGDFR